MDNFFKVFLNFQSYYCKEDFFRLLVIKKREFVMENQQVLNAISNLKGRKNYEEKKSKKLGFNSLYEYIEEKLAKKDTSEKFSIQNAEDLKLKKVSPEPTPKNKQGSCSCC